MAGRIVEMVASVIGLALLVAVLITIALAARHRPPQPPHPRRAPYRVRGRSIRGWQASAIREIRRAGRQHGRRGH